MRWVVLVALLLVGLGAYSLLSSAHDLGMSMMADTTENAGSTAPQLVDREARVSNGMAMLDVACPGTSGCRGLATIELEDGRVGSAPYALLGGQTMRYALPLPVGSRAERATVSWREDSGATASDDVKLKRS
ncbi:hypothetical protein OJ998_26220 [Solirubrobacter taibaiensis]|nr:hypothetical protein [Solirubrobacter taibaiensis]